MSIGSRLRQARERAAISVRAFQKEMEARGAKGASYPQIHRYLSPDADVEPSLAFVTIAAEVLGVRPAWLAVGEGKPTEQEQARELQARATEIATAREEDPDWNLLLSVAPWLKDTDARVRIGFREVWWRYQAFGENVPSDEAAFHLAESLSGPLTALGTEPDVSHYSYGDYAMAMLTAMLLASEVKAEGEW